MSVFTHVLRVLTGDSNANLRTTEERAEATERALHRLETRSGRVGSAAGRLAGGLGRVSPALGENAMFVNDLADGFEVLTMGGARLLRILGPVAAAAGVAAGAYMLLKQNLDQANESMKEANELATKNQELFEEVARAQNLAAVASGEMTIAELNQINAMNAGQRLFAERRKTLEDQLAAAARLRDAEVENFNRIALSSAQAAQNMDNENGRALFITATTQRLEDQTEAVDKSQDAFNKAQFALNLLNEQEAEYIDNLQTISNRNASVADSTDQSTNAFNDFKGTIEETSDSVELFADLMSGLDEAMGPGRNENITAGLEDLQRRIEIKQRLNKLEVEESQQAITESVDLSGASRGLGRAFGALTNPSTLFSALGPAGAILGGISAIGQAGGASAVEAQLDELINNLTDGFEALPEIIVKIIPPFVQALATELPPAIAAAMVGIFTEALDALFPNREKNPKVRQTFEDIFTLNVASRFGPFALGFAVKNIIERKQAASSGRMARADGARRMAISRAPTAQMMGGGPSLTINALGVDDGSQDQFQRRFARYTDPNTGLRGRE